MNISPDGVIVRFETAPEELFLSEKSGAKPNTVRILDAFEASQIRRNPPTKIIIQHNQECFLRTLTHIHFNYTVLDKVLVTFSWTNEGHHHHMKSNETEQEPYAHTMSLDNDEIEGSDHSPSSIPIAKTMRCPDCDGDLLKTRAGEFGKCAICQDLFRLDPGGESSTEDHHHHMKSNETEQEPYAHTMSLDEQEPTLDEPARKTPTSPILLPNPLIHNLMRRCGKDTLPEFISKLLDDYKSPPHTHTFGDYIAAGTAPATEEEEDKKLSLIGVSKEMSNILVRLAYDRSMDAVIRELYQIYLDNRAEEVGPLHD